MAKFQKNIRNVKLSDAPSIIKIYSHYIANSVITFETEDPSIKEIKSRIKNNLKYGWFVYEIRNQVVGYAYASLHRARTAYQWSCEISVYVDKDFHRQGIASALYDVLLKSLKLKGLVNVYAGITLPNKKSVNFHKYFGFKLVGKYRNIGYKMGHWHDVGWYELRINPLKLEPAPPKL